MPPENQNQTNQSESIPAKKPRRLRIKQQRFAEHYVATGGNGTQAAIQAGYSPISAKTTASELLTYPNVMAEIADKLSPIYTPESLQRMLTDIISKPDIAPGTRIKGVELAMRNLAMLTERREIEQRTTLSRGIDTSTMSIHELTQALVERLRLSSQGVDNDTQSDIPISASKQ